MEECCNVCEQVTYYIVCGCYEGTYTTECCGHTVTNDMWDGLTDNNTQSADYLFGEWVKGYKSLEYKPEDVVSNYNILLEHFKGRHTEDFINKVDDLFLPKFEDWKLEIPELLK